MRAGPPIRKFTRAKRVSSAAHLFNWLQLWRSHRNPVAAHGTILYETSRRFRGTAQCASTRVADLARLQRTQSRVRKRPTSPGHRISFCQYDNAGRSAAGIRSHCEWQSFCFVLCRDCQRDDAYHVGHEQYSVTGYADHSGDLCRRNSKRNGQHSERELGILGLCQRWDQQCPYLDNYLADKAFQSLGPIPTLYRNITATNSPVPMRSRSGGMTT